MGKKKLQGADGINFQMQLTIKGLETVTFPKETLTNESGKDIAWIECLGGKVSAYVNLPHAVRPNNIQPFQLSDCIQIDLISDKVIEYMKAYLKKHMKGNYSNEILKQLNVSSMECNITLKHKPSTGKQAYNMLIESLKAEIQEKQEILSHLTQDKVKQKFIENWNPTTRSVNIYDM